MSVRTWVARTIMASFPLGLRMDAARGADAYLDWLDSLPVTS
jgi:hypothetical protein